MKLRNHLLAIESILAGYDLTSGLYPHIPSMSIWRACEYAAYKRYKLSEPILDIGCGDGKYFRLVWPEINNVVGVDIDRNVLSAAEASGVYSKVYNVPAEKMKFAENTFASVFANCSLEHMENVDNVLRQIFHVLRPGGQFLLSVTTDKFLEWTTLPQLMSVLQSQQMETDLLYKYKAYHHLVTAIPAEGWAAKLDEAGFEIVEHIPILPELLSRFNLLIDMLWHISIASGGEFGTILEPYFKDLNNFPEELGNIVKSLLAMEKNMDIGSGSVFMARKRES